MGIRKSTGCCSGLTAKLFKRQANYEEQTLPKPDEAGGLDASRIVDAPEEEILIIRRIDPCIQKNGLEHRTDKYELMRRDVDPQLVIRRGQSIQLILELSRKYNPDTDGISFIFTINDEDKPSYGQKTLVALPLLEKIQKDFQWNVILRKVTDDNLMTVDILTDENAAIGEWKLEVDTRIIDAGAYCYSWDKSIFMLFNPWCKGDRVYLAPDNWKDETVLNDIGIIWRGTFNRRRPVIWKYDQFERNVLECAMYVMRVIGKVKGIGRSEPINITRALAAAVNSVDDDGVVMGNWTEDHSDGTPPTKWIGSKEILQQYYDKKKPVKYGQCWVFSGVLTSICRALGIPSRTITNYSSAHDTQGSLTVDYFVDDDGSILENLNSDSVWNFHVWNEVWMSRPDLGSKYDGWQAIDATPQEESENVYRLGPSSVNAVKHGELLRPYDNGFVFAEVNADKVFWRYAGPKQPLKLLKKETTEIGKLIYTKAPGEFEPLNITESYKYPERSGKERNTMLKALVQSESSFSRYYLNENFNDIKFEFQLRDDIIIGQPFKVSLMMSNRSKTSEYKIRALLRVESVDYTGNLGETVRKQNFDLRVKPDSLYEVALDISYDQYARKLMDQGAFNIACFATVEDTKFEYYAQDDFRVGKPEIRIDLREKANLVENKEILVDLCMVNPLPEPLRKGEFTVDVPGLDKIVRIRLKKPVPPGEKATGCFRFVAPRSGDLTIVAKFVSKELNDCDGYRTIFVQPAS